jgi:protein-tyrosine phosphatase
MKILMVCLGNICRSPLAEGILKQKAAAAGKNWQIESAGTNGYHVGEAPHKLSQKVAKLRGIDISTQCARQFISADFHHYDIIYAMADEVIAEMKWIAGSAYVPSKVKLIMDEVFPGKMMDVPDPWYGPEPGYHEVYDMIEQACDAIIKKYSGHR